MEAIRHGASRHDGTRINLRVNSYGRSSKNQDALTFGRASLWKTKLTIDHSTGRHDAKPIIRQPRTL